MNNLREDLWRFLTNRLFVTLIIISISYYLLILRLFDLQIVKGSEYQKDLRLTTLIELPISAPRGNIYDKFGRPLAKNESSFSIKLDPSLKPETIDALYKGMLAVTEGSHGTARAVFQDSPISVAGKTGTPQETSNRNDHSSFGGFALFENPQIAVYVSIPFGDTLTTSSSAARVAKEVIAQYMGFNDEPERPESINSLYK